MQSVIVLSVQGPLSMLVTTRGPGLELLQISRIHFRVLIGLEIMQANQKVASLLLFISRFDYLSENFYSSEFFRSYARYEMKCMLWPLAYVKFENMCSLYPF